MTDSRSFRQSRILIVDDEQGNVEVLERILDRAGFTAPRQHHGLARRADSVRAVTGPISSCWISTCRTWMGWR